MNQVLKGNEPINRNINWLIKETKEVTVVRTNLSRRGFPIGGVYVTRKGDTLLPVDLKVEKRKMFVYFEPGLRVVGSLILPGVITKKDCTKIGTLCVPRVTVLSSIVRSRMLFFWLPVWVGPSNRRVGLLTPLLMSHSVTTHMRRTVMFTTE